MANKIFHDPQKEIYEIRNQISYVKRIGFLLGAGTSKALNISDLSGLTKKVREKIEQKYKDILKNVETGLRVKEDDDPLTIEQILDQVRLIRQLADDKPDRNFEKVSGKDAAELDIEICNRIYEIIVEEEKKVDLSHTKKFVTWLNWLSRDYSKEIFTTNYDLIIEKALENLHIPHFDGFVGAYQPFFFSESLESKNTYDIPPISWIRLWKLHGSINWFWKKNNSGKSNKVVRLGVESKKLNNENELVIYPSKEKYETSRKQPFIAYFDRLRNFLQDGEGIFVINGYSFSDEHINAVIVDSLKQNNRLHIIGFFFSDDDLIKICELGTFLNFTAISPRKAIIRGFLGEWKKAKSDHLLDSFWDIGGNRLKIGDFKEMVKFLMAISGKQEKIEEIVKGSNDK
jgi:hypothetical protein